MAPPSVALTFGPDKISVTGGLAYEIGSYQLTPNDKSGTPQPPNGKYVVICRKQPDGSWKVFVDAPATTQ